MLALHGQHPGHNPQYWAQVEVGREVVRWVMSITQALRRLEKEKEDFLKFSPSWATYILKRRQKQKPTSQGH